MKNSARGELVEPCELRVSVVKSLSGDPRWPALLSQKRKRVRALTN